MHFMWGIKNIGERGPTYLYRPVLLYYILTTVQAESLKDSCFGISGGRVSVWMGEILPVAQVYFHAVSI